MHAGRAGDLNYCLAESALAQASAASPGSTQSYSRSNKICAAMAIGRLTEPVVDTLVGGLAHVIFRLHSRDESAVSR